MTSIPDNLLIKFSNLGLDPVIILVSIILTLGIAIFSIMAVNALIAVSPLNINVIIIIKGTCHEIGNSNVSIGLVANGIEIKAGINVEIIIN